MDQVLEELLNNKSDLAFNDNLKLYVWGTGNTSMLYLEGLERLKSEGMVISGYVDNNSEKWGKTFADGNMIISPDELATIEDVLVLIASPQPTVIQAVSTQLEALGINWMHIDNYIFSKHKEEIYKCIDLLQDNRSKEVYKELIKCRIKGIYPDDNIVDKDQYFSFRDFGEYNSAEVYIDCGSYVGDSIERYIWSKDGSFKKIIGIEPDLKNIKAIEYRIDRLKKEWNLDDSAFEIYPYGLSDKSTVSYVERYDNNNGFGSKLINTKTENSTEVKTVALDDIVDGPVGFIKADIESYEYKMILGAKRIISEKAPKMAVCIYHNAVDFYSVIHLIKSINPDYKFSLRHYTHYLSETVLYAYI